MLVHECTHKMRLSGLWRKLYCENMLLVEYMIISKIEQPEKEPASERGRGAGARILLMRKVWDNRAGPSFHNHNGKHNFPVWSLVSDHRVFLYFSLHLLLEIKVCEITPLKQWPAERHLSGPTSTKPRPSVEPHLCHVLFTDPSSCWQPTAKGKALLPGLLRTWRGHCCRLWSVRFLCNPYEGRRSVSYLQ